MLIPAVFLFVLFLLLCAFFASAETAFIASSPYTLDYLAKKGSKRARLVKKMLSQIDHLLAAILIGNTLVNVAAASIATFIFVSFVPDKNQAVLLATLTTTVLLLLFGEISPKTYAAHHPLKVSFFFIYPIRVFVFLFYPLVKAFTFLSSLIFRSTQEQTIGISPPLNEEETKILLTSGIKGMSTLRKKMITEILDIGSRPIKEIMIPSPQVKAIEVGSSKEQILDTILSSGHSRFPVYKGGMDNIEGILHARDIIPYIIDNKEINIYELIRRPVFVPESASIEKVLLQMQENSVHVVLVVDEFGNMEGIVAFEDIIEEIVGEIKDEYDSKAEEWYSQVDEKTYTIKGSASVKEINRILALQLPEKGEYTTLAGFFLYEFGRIPHEKDSLEFKGHRLIVEKMNKRHISLIQLSLIQSKKESSDESHRI
jgi:putative hemolysin